MPSKSIYKVLKPTYLYIKQHSVTGLKYFGKTTKKDPNKYLGSGKYWTRHIKKHGTQFVETIWLSDLFINEKILIEFSILISEHWDIVKSDKWANLKLENGIDGGGGYGGKGKVAVKDKIGNNFLIDKTDHRYLSGELISVAKNKVTTKDITGIIHYVDKTDHRYLSGELVGNAKGLRRSEETKRKQSISGKGKKRSEEIKINIGISSRKSYIVTSPTGDIYKVHGLKHFCIDHALNYSSMCNIANNKTQSHSGWVCIKDPISHKQ